MLKFLRVLKINLILVTNFEDFWECSTPSFTLSLLQNNNLTLMANYNIFTIVAVTELYS